MLDFALDMVTAIKDSLEAGKQLVLLLPARVSPYAPAIINAMGISCRHVHTYNMDEYADEDGRRNAGVGNPRHGYCLFRGGQTPGRRGPMH